MAKQKTGAQVFSQPSLGKLAYPTEKRMSPDAWRRKLNQMRRDPTISLARMLSLAPFFAAEWTVEATEDAPEGAETFIYEHLKKHKLHLIENLVYGTIDWGWQAFEKVYELTEDQQVTIGWYKPLLQSISEILVVEGSGEFNGVYQLGVEGVEATLGRDVCLFHSINVEGTDWYGVPIMQAAEMPFEHWLDVEIGANRYDRKVSGAHWIVWYPVGRQDDGTDNYDVAKNLLNSLESSGSAIIPREVQRIVDTLDGGANTDNSGWKIELITDSGSGSTAYLDRQKYFDTLKVRAFGLPERAVIEGQYGTKAEAGEHGDFAVAVAEMRHQAIAKAVNAQSVDDLLSKNHGREAKGSVYLSVSPLADGTRQQLAAIYDKILADPVLGPDEIEQIDVAALREKLSVPTKATQEETQPA